MVKSIILPLVASLVFASVACAAETNDPADPLAGEADELSVSRTFTARGTGYYPDNSALEGGFFDRRGKRLYTLQQFLSGNAPYVSVAMDTTAFAYGTRLRIAEFNTRYGREVIFRVVDTGGAFKNKGTSRMDICTANNAASLDKTVNATLSVSVINEKDGATAPASNGPSSKVTAPKAATCTNDGTCNPGDQGSGLICVSSTCVAGCKTDAQCPGVLTCNAGKCTR
jgi:3D (Asp-Asp-Asp) domain-containing protein